ncbi:NAD(+) synthase [Mesoplasma lactucae]|uniref:NH(3)-dependent NAD(+) synthetase n=1 Tax=Mesoplasma lactucae ATCC 49193 TaxID=81460 RepID=A0A291IRG6_9MOLU|nr:NAD(+) synthase [Mesoplasma lactucae]ATG97328.1 NAD(+) synthase [Mesoplasma lactucae ATCC 49193]ATZ20221.1 NH(3)-dependent NAD(+) synthetase [Mesoplasma lactucae ATCC 49193]MCL8216970.1 NH(3)-dependent NAD(+) synthetase [Mesoplasma lactucae ATCC 49193]
MELKEYLDYLVKFIRQTVKDAHCDGVVVGISGGIDSAVVAMLAKKAFPDNSLTIWMPCDSSKEDYDCANQLIKAGDLNTLTIDLKATFEAMLNTFKQQNFELSKLATANIKARLRMTTLYATAQTKNYLVLGTDNADEWYIGYFTKFGDGGVDAVPLIHLLKSEVREAAKMLGVPEDIITRKPTAGLWENQTDESEIGYSYDQIDNYLKTKHSDDAKLVERIETLHKNSEHKRHPAIQPLQFERNN